MRNSKYTVLVSLEQLSQELRNFRDLYKIKDLGFRDFI